MTSEKRTLIGFADIKAVSLECKKCEVRFTYAPAQALKVPETCPNPNCNSVWSPRTTRGFNGVDNPLSVRFLDMLAGLITEQGRTGPDRFRILLEFDEAN
jgi:hypothetical protein